MLFLHGSGERGTDLELLKLYGIPRVLLEGADFPFIVVSPQCPPHTVWANELDALRALVDNVIQEHRVDRTRIYLTGLSMGGNGAWHLAADHPFLFAAVVPICGWANPYLGFPERIQILKDVPVWAFHGEKDDVVPIKGSQELVDVLIAHDGNVRFTIYPDAAHDSWTETYANPELYEWLLRQKLSRAT